MTRPPAVQHEYQRDPIFRAVRRFSLFAWRLRFGWMFVLAVAAITIGAVYALPILFPLFDQIIIVLLWVCLGLLVGMFRRQMRGRAPRWDQLGTAGKLARLLVTVFGTALLLAPFVWLGWKILARQ